MSRLHRLSNCHALQRRLQISLQLGAWCRTQQELAAKGGSQAVGEIPREALDAAEQDEKSGGPLTNVGCETSRTLLITSFLPSA
jgi:hypothetical protein